MARIASIESGCYRVPLPVVLSDSTHGEMKDFELVSARVRDADGAEGLGYTYSVHGFGLERFVAEPMRVVEGCAIAPERPGHGVTLDFRRLEAHRVR